ncbi:MAG: outer membrane protein assembly factor BamA [Nitrospirae bacterium]|nr:outer membrane protein assembly factor BamA [Nitrospirota bacterium]
MKYKITLYFNGVKGTGPLVEGSEGRQSLPFFLCSFFIALILFNFAEVQAAPVKVSHIAVLGLHSISEEEFLYMFGISVGEDLTAEKVRTGISRAFVKGVFDDIKVSVVGTKVLVEVVERLFIDSIEVSGVSYLSGKKVKELLTLKEGMLFHTDAVERCRQDLRDSLLRHGFPAATVNIAAEKSKSPNRVKLLVNVNEGQPDIIREVLINGQPMTESLIDIRSGDIYNQQQIEEKLSEVKKILQKEGFLGYIIGPYVFDPKAKVLDIKMDKGKSLKIAFRGLSVFSEDTLINEMPFSDTGSVTQDSVNEAIQTMVSLYHQAGYINAVVTAKTWLRPDSYDVLFDMVEGDKYEISDIIFEGVTIDKNKLKDTLSLKKGQAVNPDVIDDEEDAVTLYYNSIGFTDAVVDSFDIIPDSDNKTALIKIAITEGVQSKIAKINITGNRFINTETIAPLIAMTEGCNLHGKAGDPLDETNIFNAKTRIITYYNRHGYGDVNVKVTTQAAETATTGCSAPGIVLTFIIEEGRGSVFGKTIVNGNQRTKWEVFRRIIKHQSGDAFNVTKLYEEVKDLYKTGLFSSVEFSVVEGDSASLAQGRTLLASKDNKKQIKDVIFKVKEANHGVIDYGVGYGEYEGLRGFFDVKYINLGGMNRQISLRTKVSSISQKYSLSYVEPWFTSYALPLRSTLSFEKREELDVDTRKIRYQLEKYTASSGVEKELSDNLKGQLSYEFNLVKTWDVSPDVTLSREDTGTLIISSIVPSILFDTRDNPSNPTDGFLIGASLKLASNLLLSQSNFIKAMGHINYYKALFKDITLAISLRSGMGQGWQRTVDLPLVERFFLGGSTSVRGYAQDTLGPKGSNGVPVGGNAFTMTNLELRFKVVGDFGLVSFVDTGGVWNDFKAINPLDVRYTTGMGLRYMTAIGPLRMDYGYKLNREKDEQPGRFYFSIGQAF